MNNKREPLHKINSVLCEKTLESFVKSNPPYWSRVDVQYRLVFPPLSNFYIIFRSLHLKQVFKACVTNIADNITANKFEADLIGFYRNKHQQIAKLDPQT